MTTKVETNFIEILLRTAIIGKTIDLDDDITAITIVDLNYEPRLRTVYVFDGTDTHKVLIDTIFTLVEVGETRIRRGAKKRIRGKKKRNW